jgi:hypothetical protein
VVETSPAVAAVAVVAAPFVVSVALALPLAELAAAAVPSVAPGMPKVAAPTPAA